VALLPSKTGRGKVTIFVPQHTRKYLIFPGFGRRFRLFYRAQMRVSGPNEVVEPSRHPFARFRSDLGSRRSPNVRFRVKKALNGHFRFPAEVAAGPRPRARAQRRFSGPNGVVGPSRHPFARLRIDLRSRRSPNVRIRVKKGHQTDGHPLLLS
jgi:hypothetical protein